MRPRAPGADGVRRAGRLAPSRCADHQTPAMARTVQAQARMPPATASPSHNGLLSFSMRLPSGAYYSRIDMDRRIAYTASCENHSAEPGSAHSQEVTNGTADVNRTTYAAIAGDVSAGQGRGYTGGRAVQP